MIINKLKVRNLFCELVDFVTIFDEKLSERMSEIPSPQSVNRPEVGISIKLAVCNNWRTHSHGVFKR